MHIAFLTPEYPHPGCNASGGLGTSIKNLAQVLVKHGVEVSLVIYAQEEDRNFVEEGISFHLIRQKTYKIGGWLFYRKYLQNFINRLAEKENIDLVEAADWTGITAFMKLRVPVVLRLHGSDTYFCALEGRKQKWKNKWFEKVALKNADHLVSVSLFTGRRTVELFNLNRDFKVIPNGVDLDKFADENENIDPDQLLYFGSVIRKKGILELALIFNILVEERPKTQLLIAGRDVVDARKKKSTLELFQSRLSAKALENFTYLGEVEYEKVKEHLSTAAVIVLPSFAEAFPMTWLEAMAMEKALVTSNIGWAQEIMVNGETGYTESPEAHEAYADKILKLLENETLRNKMASNAKSKISKEFSSKIVVTRNIEFYNSILKQHN